MEGVAVFSASGVAVRGSENSCTYFTCNQLISHINWIIVGFSFSVDC